MCDGTLGDWSTKPVDLELNPDSKPGNSAVVLYCRVSDLGNSAVGTLGDWSTKPVDLELNPDSKPFDSRYYMVPIINKEIFRKDLK